MAQGKFGGEACPGKLLTSAVRCLLQMYRELPE